MMRAEAGGNILGCAAQSVICTGMEKEKDKVGVTAHTPVSFPRWREVLHSEISDLSKRNGMEQDIFAYSYSTIRLQKSYRSILSSSKVSIENLI